MAHEEELAEETGRGEVEEGERERTRSKTGSPERSLSRGSNRRRRSRSVKRKSRSRSRSRKTSRSRGGERRLSRRSRTRSPESEEGYRLHVAGANTFPVMVVEGGKPKSQRFLVAIFNPRQSLASQNETQTQPGKPDLEE